MARKKNEQPTSQEKSDQAKERAERGKRIVARVLADKEFMAGVEEGRESQRRGEGVSLKDLQESAQAKERAERARKMVKRITANKEFMKGVERGIEAGRRGEGVPLKDLQRKNAGR